MRIWIYGDSLEQIQDIAEAGTNPGDIVVDTSVCAEAGSAFPQSGLTQAISSAIRGKIDLLLVPELELLGGKDSSARTIELFESYGVSVKSVSSCGSSSS